MREKKKGEKKKEKNRNKEGNSATGELQRPVTPLPLYPYGQVAQVYLAKHVEPARAGLVA